MRDQIDGRQEERERRRDDEMDNYKTDSRVCVAYVSQKGNIVLCRMRVQ